MTTAQSTQTNPADRKANVLACICEAIEQKTGKTIPVQALTKERIRSLCPALTFLHKLAETDEKVGNYRETFNTFDLLATIQLGGETLLSAFHKHTTEEKDKLSSVKCPIGYAMNQYLTGDSDTTASNVSKFRNKANISLSIVKFLLGELPAEIVISEKEVEMDNVTYPYTIEEVCALSAEQFSEIRKLVSNSGGSSLKIKDGTTQAHNLARFFTCAERKYDLTEILQIVENEKKVKEVKEKKVSLIDKYGNGKEYTLNGVNVMLTWNTVTSFEIINLESWDGEIFDVSDSMHVLEALIPCDSE